MSVISNINRSPGGDNKAGISKVMYFALAEDVQTWPSLPSTATTYEHLVSYESDFVMKTGKQFWEFNATVERSSLNFESAGERGSKSAVNLLEIVRASIDDTILGFLESHKNDEMVWIVEDLDDNFRVLGTKQLPAMIEEFGGNSGATVSDDKHAKVTVRASGDIARVYTGQTIPLTPAA